jgi:hypothetical protein
MPREKTPPEHTEALEVVEMGEAEAEEHEDRWRGCCRSFAEVVRRIETGTPPKVDDVVRLGGRGEPANAG